MAWFESPIALAAAGVTALLVVGVAGVLTVGRRCPADGQAWGESALLAAVLWVPLVWVPLPRFLAAPDPIGAPVVAEAHVLGDDPGSGLEWGERTMALGESPGEPLPATQGSTAPSTVGAQPRVGAGRLDRPTRGPACPILRRTIRRSPRAFGHGARRRIRPSGDRWGVVAASVAARRLGRRRAIALGAGLARGARRGADPPRGRAVESCRPTRSCARGAGSVGARRPGAGRLAGGVAVLCGGFGALRLWCRETCCSVRPTSGRCWPTSALTSIAAIRPGAG